MDTELLGLTVDAQIQTLLESGYQAKTPSEQHVWSATLRNLLMCKRIMLIDQAAKKPSDEPEEEFAVIEKYVGGMDRDEMDSIRASQVDRR